METKKYLKAHSFYLGILAIVGLGIILSYTRSFMIPFTIAALIGILVDPVLTYLQRQGIPEIVGSLLVFLGIFIILTAIGFLLYSTISSITQDIEGYSSQAKEIIDRISDLTEQYFNFDLNSEISKNGKNQFNRFFSQERVMTLINSTLGSFLSFFSALLTMLLFLLFMLLTRHSLRGKICHFLSEHELSDQSSEDLVESIADQVQKYLWLKTIISVGTGFAVWLAAIVLQLDFPIAWGLIAFVLNYIPSLGPILASVPPIALAYFQYYDHLGWATLVALVMIFIQFTSGNIIEPRVMGEGLNLNIIVVLLCLFVWGIVWGFAGMVISIPLTASINIALKNSTNYRHLSILLSN